MCIYIYIYIYIYTYMYIHITKYSWGVAPRSAPPGASADDIIRCNNNEVWYDVRLHYNVLLIISLSLCIYIYKYIYMYMYMYVRERRFPAVDGPGGSFLSEKGELRLSKPQTEVPQWFLHFVQGLLLDQYSLVQSPDGGNISIRERRSAPGILILSNPLGILICLNRMSLSQGE